MPAITLNNSLISDGTITLEKPTFFINCEFRSVTIMSPNFAHVLFIRCVFKDDCDISIFPPKAFQQCDFINTDVPI